jgi:hypothetical protein
MAMDKKTLEKVNALVAKAHTALDEALALRPDMCKVKIVIDNDPATNGHISYAFYTPKQLERMRKYKLVPLTNKEREWLADLVDSDDEACTYHTGGGNHKRHADLIRRLTEK